MTTHPHQVVENQHQTPAKPDPWERLRRFTDARIALGRAGAAIPVGETLNFRLAHARARDAVHTGFEAERLAESLSKFGCEAIRVESAAATRELYLTRPDLGRKLSERSALLLEARSEKPNDLCLVVADGLSARAVHENAVPFLDAFLPMCRDSGFSLSPLVIAEQGRVAIGDAIAQRLRSKMVAILIGERPGLSSPDSMGVYLTHSAREGTTDEARNCISNVRKAGIKPSAAALKLAYLVDEARALGFSGVKLKDNMPDAYLPFARSRGLLDQ